MKTKVYSLFGLLFALFLVTGSVSALNINQESLALGKVRPGQVVYSDSFLLGNPIDSGVSYELSISGTDVFDPSNAGAQCPLTNIFLLENIDYAAYNGAYSTRDNANADAEGFVQVPYNDLPMIDVETANIIGPGQEVLIIFRATIPEGCRGTYNAGQIKLTGHSENQEETVYLPISLKAGRLMDPTPWALSPFQH